MIKIAKFGGSSVADAEHFKKIKAIVDADPARRFVVVSACGRRFKGDTKVTDLLYLVNAHVKYHVSCEELLEDIGQRYFDIADELELTYPIREEFAAFAERARSGGYSTEELVSRGEYFTARLMAEYLGLPFLDAATVVAFHHDGTLSMNRTSELVQEYGQQGGFDAYTASDVLRGSGLSSSAAFEMGVAIILNTEYGCGLDAPALARICQFAENTYFGKPSGLLDQLTSAVGGVLFADFADPTAPKIEKIHADGVLPEGMTLCVTDTRASHSELTGEFAAIRNEMEAVAACLGGRVLGEVDEKRFWQELPRLREQCGDRAVLRAIHYFEENARTLAQRDALVAGDFAAFARLVEKSGHSSFECCQNVYCASSPKHQGLSAALAISQSILSGTGGAWRMQGGGFAGTIQAFVPDALIKRYCAAMEALFGPGCCYLLSLREQGAVRVM